VLTCYDNKCEKNEIEEKRREKEITDNSWCLRTPSFQVAFMADLTRIPLTYLNGRSARERDYACVYREKDDVMAPAH